MPAERPSVVVLGGGFLGVPIARALLHAGWAVTVVTRASRFTRAGPLLAGCQVVFGDVRDAALLDTAVARADHVVYAVGSASPAESEADPAADLVRVVPPLVQLLERLRLRPGTAVTFLSSGGAVYGNGTAAPVSERSETAPISSYGIIKLTCERYVAMYRSVQGVDGRVLRIGNVYGPGQRTGRGQGLVAHLLEATVTGATVPLYGRATSVRDYIHVDDVADAVAASCGLAGAPEVLNVGTGVGRTVDDVLRCVEAVTGVAVATRELPPRPFDVAGIVLDITALQSLVGFAPRTLEAGIGATWAPDAASRATRGHADTGRAS